MPESQQADREKSVKVEPPKRANSKLILKINNSKERLPKSSLSPPSRTEGSEAEKGNADIHPSFVLDELTEKRQAVHGAEGLTLKDTVRPLTSKENEPSNASTVLNGDTASKVEILHKGSEGHSTVSSLPHSPSLSSDNITKVPSIAAEFPPKDDNKIHLLIGVTGTTSAYKIFPLIKKLFDLYTPEKLAIKIVMTGSALNILSLQDFASGQTTQDGKAQPNLKKKTNWRRILDMGIERIWTDKDAYNFHSKDPGVMRFYDRNFHSEPILHLELGRWADLMVIAPLSANTLAKIVNGLATNLLTTIVATWNRQKPIIAALSINNMAYSQPITQVHLNLTKEYFPYIQVLKPLEKIVGKGTASLAGMREWPDIVEVVMKKIGPPSNFEDEDDEDDNADSNNGGDNEEEVKNETDTDTEGSDDSNDDGVENDSLDGNEEDDDINS